MFGNIRKRLSEYKFTGIIELPTNGLIPVVRHYNRIEGERVPMQLVVIYNVEQLAIEIAKHLNNSNGNATESNSDAN